jgi:hypothetical protein
MKMQTAPYPYGFSTSNGHIPLELAKLRLELIFCPECWQGISGRMFLPAQESRMRFHVGELYQGSGPNGPRLATVLETYDDGHVGKLRISDDGQELTVNWQELHQCGQWKRVTAQG